MTTTDYRLTDRFTADRGTVFLSGIQALARLPIDQLRADRRAGLRTAAFVSGTRVAARRLRRTVRQAREAGVGPADRVPPAVNEEYAATAVMGIQLADARPTQRYDGVLGIWYGKAPGVDRATDAMRHAVFAARRRTAARSRSSATTRPRRARRCRRRRPAMVRPAHADALPRRPAGGARPRPPRGRAVTGRAELWTAIKIVAESPTAPAPSSLDPDRVVPVIPTIEYGLAASTAAPRGACSPRYTLDMEREFYEVRSVLAGRVRGASTSSTASRRRARRRLDRHRRVGQTYHELREALPSLGLRRRRVDRRAGIRLLQLSMPVPLDHDTVREFAHGLREVLVVEEKNPTLELLVKSALYTWPSARCRREPRRARRAARRPAPERSTPTRCSPALRARTHRRDRRSTGSTAACGPLSDRGSRRSTARRSTAAAARTTSPRGVPDGTLVGGGIGCHTMAR